MLGGSHEVKIQDIFRFCLFYYYFFLQNKCVVEHKVLHVFRVEFLTLTLALRRMGSGGGG